MKNLFTILAMLITMNASGQWMSDVRLTYDPAYSMIPFSNNWCIATSGSFVHVVWFDSRSGEDGDVYYKRSSDGGISWGGDIRISYSGRTNFPTIAASGPYVHIVWNEDRTDTVEIYYRRSIDNGENWESDKRLTHSRSEKTAPCIALSGSFVHIVWADTRGGKREVYYKKSSDIGENWGIDTRIATSYNDSQHPTVAASAQLVFVVWEDLRHNASQSIYYNKSTDGGLNWGGDTRLTIDVYSYYPSVAVSGSNLHVVWYNDNLTSDKVFYKHSTDGGNTWSVDLSLVNTSNSSFNPSIAISGQTIHVVWYDSRENPEIYYKRSTNGGASWDIETRLTNQVANSLYPSIAVSGTKVHVVWQEGRNGATEIYYKQNPTGNPIGIININSEMPEKYSLSQNYPNPFNPMTNVKFSIVKAGDVKIVVYDVQGREVQTLVNERLNAGTYEVKFDGSMLTSGVYFYKMLSEGFTETKRMLLIK